MEEDWSTEQAQCTSGRLEAQASWDATARYLVPLRIMISLIFSTRADMISSNLSVCCIALRKRLPPSRPPLTSLAHIYNHDAVCTPNSNADGYAHGTKSTISHELDA